jgi:glycosyltransferase involved in cell wall biosynthesis
LSVVIPALNEERHLGELLSDLRRQSLKPEEVIVVDAGSRDATVRIAKLSSCTAVLHGKPPVARGRNLGGYSAKGDLIFFLDADTRLPQNFFEDFVGEVEERRLDIACPCYLPYGPSPTIRAIHAFWNALLKGFERTLPSGAGHCIALRSRLFRESSGFDTDVLVSDRRYREQGILRTFLLHLLMAPAFALGKFEWANRIDYEFGNHAH